MHGPKRRGHRTCGPWCRSSPTTLTVCGGMRTRSYGSARTIRHGRTWNASSAGSITVRDAMADTIDSPAEGSEDPDEVIVRATVSRLVVTLGAPVAVVEPVVRDELERRRASARIQVFVPILTERAARRRLKDRPPA